MVKDSLFTWKSISLTIKDLQTGIATTSSFAHENFQVAAGQQK